MSTLSLESPLGTKLPTSGSEEDVIPESTPLIGASFKDRPTSWTDPHVPGPGFCVFPAPAPCGNAGQEQATGRLGSQGQWPASP